MTVAVHGDDFSLCGCEEDLSWLRDLMKTRFEIKVRAILGPEGHGDKEVVISERLVTWKEDFIEYEADPKHRRKILEYFGFDGHTKAGGVNGYREERVGEEGEELLERSDAKEFRGLAARGNFMS
eukprot:9127582-Karenia_brevis.AAC.1